MSLAVTECESLSTVDAHAWDALTGKNSPFVEHAFLVGMELSGSVGDEATGWMPRHLLVREDGALVGAMPLYLKLDSYGEYIFDWSWANASARAGVPYYPKLVSAVPFTPATGPRLLIAPEADVAGVTAVALEGLKAVLERDQAWSAHVLFCTEAERDTLSESGFIPRTTYQFHWQNGGDWASFDDYLGALRSRVRKEVRRERRIAGEHGLDLQMRRGTELTEEDWEALWRFYRITTTRKHAIPYLTHDFFLHAKEHLQHRVVAALAYREGRPVAGSLSFHKGDTLY
ncbi:MAG: GNAT family N-acetyltransferase, partial [Myxococcota bacterium]|nr:GNAT family N-acetyltransferase [Myxococcota bacterium]